MKGEKRAGAIDGDTFSYDERRSLTARGDPNFFTKTQFKKTVESHLNWYNRKPTPFVSVFEDREHALNWAGLRGDQVVMLEVNASQLGCLFSVWSLVMSGLVNTRLSDHVYQDEYLVLRGIPEQSIINRHVVSLIGCSRGGKSLI
ncbi:putative tyrosinase Copper binding domain-containing protein [Phytophthora infestans]|uniref:Putative tyrosinase Copper binding domain-containing protein n=1 Tax=Phytophthora infestans TaxID=4787 RepID=A0A833WHR1_PHYIN|nr:putative tyrosinase Copper binding domain-containing protein [Phytophthora infestans]KAF4134670.1 putative tyrosinase domain-containing protein [Phytophthora infestans]